MQEYLAYTLTCLSFEEVQQLMWVSVSLFWLTHGLVFYI